MTAIEPNGGGHTKHRGPSQRAAGYVGAMVAAGPLKAMCSCCLIIILFPVILIATVGIGMTEEGFKDWAVLSAVEVERGDAIVLAEAETDCLPDENGDCPLTSERENIDFSRVGTSLMYKTNDGSPILTASNLREMCKVERTFVGIGQYPTACQLPVGTAATVHEEGGSFTADLCMTQSTSIVQYAYLQAGDSDKLANCELLSDTAVAAFSESLHAGLNSDDTFSTVGFFLGKDVVSDGAWSGSYTATTRSMLGLGYPLEGRSDASSIDLSTPEAREAYSDNFYDTFMDEFYGKFGYTVGGSPMSKDYLTGKVEILFEGSIMQNVELLNAVNVDMSLAGASVAFTALYLTFHTGSLFVAMISIWQVCISLLVALFWYRIIFQISYFRQLHMLLVFVILGIGADNVFVFSDAWRQHTTETLARRRKLMIEEDKDKVLADRIAYAWHHSMSSVFNTALTTSLAFFATSISPIMPIMTMGYYGSLLIVVNYIFLITFTPCVFAVFEVYRKYLTVPIPARLRRLCSKTPKTHSPPDTDPESGLPAVTSSAPTTEATATTTATAEEEEAKTEATTATAPSADEGKGAKEVELVPEARKDVHATLSDAEDDANTSWILRSVLLPILSKKIVSAVLATILFSWGILNCIFATQLSSPLEALKWFPDDHMVEKAKDWAADMYAANAGSDYAIATIAFGLEGVDRDQEPYVDKWKPHEWYGVPVYDSSFDLSTADAQEYFRGFCDRLAAAECSEEGCGGYGKLVMPEVGALSCFLQEFHTANGDVTYEGDEFLEKLKKFRSEATPSSSSVGGSTWKTAIGFTDGKLKYVEVKAKLTLKGLQADIIKEPIMDLLQAFVEKEAAKAPAGLKSIIQTVPYEWTMLITTRAILNGMWLGFAVCFPVVFVVLVAATANILVAILAVLTIIIVVGNVLGYCWMAGWSLGITESIAAIIVIGLSVDYVIHLGHMYLEAGHREGHSSRESRWKYAMKMMGGTVVAGAATTLGAGLVMQFCTIVFFTQMSTLIVMTILYSILYSMVAFMGCLLLFGPQGNTGDVSWIPALLLSKLRPNKADNAEEPPKVGEEQGKWAHKLDTE